MERSEEKIGQDEGSIGQGSMSLRTTWALYQILPKEKKKSGDFIWNVEKRKFSFYSSWMDDYKKNIRIFRRDFFSPCWRIEPNVSGK